MSAQWFCEGGAIAKWTGVIGALHVEDDETVGLKM